MTYYDDAKSAIDAAEREHGASLAKISQQESLLETDDALIASLQAELDALKNPPPPPSTDPKLRWEITRFRQTTGPTMNIMGGVNEDAAKSNTQFGPDGELLLKCDGKQGAAVMFKDPHPTGYWEVECYFGLTAFSPNKSTKVCLVLWPDGGGWSATHHEIDFNESGLRYSSHQTVHGENAAGVHKMAQTSYPTNQYEKHVYGVRVGQNYVTYTLDGKAVAGVAGNDKLKGINWKDNWNLHLRSIPNGSTDKTTLVVTRVKATE